MAKNRVAGFIFILIALCNTRALSQTEFIPKTGFGLNQGINISQMNFSVLVGQEPLYSYTGGLSFKHVSEKNLGIQIEANIARRGWGEDGGKYQRKLSYFELPFMTYIEMGPKKTKFLINFGPNISYLVLDREKIELDEGVGSRIYYGKTIDNKFEFGMVGSLGVARSMTTGELQIEARFGNGLNSVFIREEDLFEYSQTQFVNVKLAYLHQLK